MFRHSASEVEERSIGMVHKAKDVSIPTSYKLLDGEAQSQPHLLFCVLRIEFFVMKC